MSAFLRFDSCINADKSAASNWAVIMRFNSRIDVLHAIPGSILARETTQHELHQVIILIERHWQ